MECCEADEWQNKSKRRSEDRFRRIDFPVWGALPDPLGPWGEFQELARAWIVRFFGEYKPQTTAYHLQEFGVV